MNDPQRDLCVSARLAIFVGSLSSVRQDECVDTDLDQAGAGAGVDGANQELGLGTLDGPVRY